MVSYTHLSNRLLKPTMLSLSLIATTPIVTHQAFAQPLITTAQQAEKFIQFNEWRYIRHANPPTLMWWNERMSKTVPTLYLVFTPDKIILNAVTPIWPDTGILFYIKDKSEKQGINLTLLKKDQQHNYYSATIDTANRQKFINNLVTSRKARLITPSSYSQSLSLKKVDQAVQFLSNAHPRLRLTLPQAIRSSR